MKSTVIIMVMATTLPNEWRSKGRILLVGIDAHLARLAVPIGALVTGSSNNNNKAMSDLQPPDTTTICQRTTTRSQENLRDAN